MSTINVEPISALVDAPVRITIGKLNPNQEITLYSAHMDEDNLLAICFAHYVANEHGNVDLDRDPSIGGMYSGIDPMGLFWAMRRPYDSPLKYKYVRKRDVTKPQIIYIHLYLSHLEENEINRADAVSKVKVERWFINDAVERIPVSVGRVRGVMFIPKGQGPYPGVISIHGYNPGLFQSPASLLACHGFATFAVAYYCFDDLPYRPSKFELEYFEEALNFFRNQEKVLNGGIGLHGDSLGGTIVCAMATYLPGIASVVNVSGPVFSNMFDITYKGRVWPCIPWDYSKGFLKDNLTIATNALRIPLLESLGKSMIEMHKSNASFLFLYGANDQFCDSMQIAALAKSIFKLTKKTDYEIIIYPDAGHVIEEPYHPIIITSHENLNYPPLYFGGTPKGQAMASESAWANVLEFLRIHLPKIDAQH